MPFSSSKKPLFLKRPPTWSNLFSNNNKTLKHVIFKMQQPPPISPSTINLDDNTLHTFTLPHSAKNNNNIDLTLLLSDEILIFVLTKLPLPSLVQQHTYITSHHPQTCNTSLHKFKCYSLVCRRWLRLLGSLVSSVRLLDFNFLESRKLVARFPNLTDVDVSKACVDTLPYGNEGIVLTNRFLSVSLECSEFSEGGGLFRVVADELVDIELGVLAEGCKGLRRLVLMGGSEVGLRNVAAECGMLQELEIHKCRDDVLKGVGGFRNLQLVRLIGSVDGVYKSVVSDIGMTILGHGCKRLVKLELCGCEGSYDGIKAIGQCCVMLEELTLCDHRMDGGWLAGLSSCGNLKTLRLQSCKKIDDSPGPVEYLGSCPTLETLHLQRCQLRDKQRVHALFLVCGAVREIVIQDCWGLSSEMFGIANNCRRVNNLSLEGCSMLTTEGLESVVLSWVELQRLKVVSCNNIKDSEITPALSSLFSVLKELKWRPDTKSLLSSSLAGTGVGKKGCRFFKRRTGKTSQSF